MKKTIALTVAALLAAATARATIIQLDFMDGTAIKTGQIGSSGYWTSVDGGATATGNVADLIDHANTSTGISMTWGNLSGFQNSGRGENGTGVAGTANDGLSTWTAAATARDPNSGITTTDGKFFPWSVVGTFSADNRDSGRDSLMTFTFASDTPLTYSFWVVSSYDHNNPAAANHVGLFNVGGTYDYNTGFTGGGDADPGFGLSASIVRHDPGLRRDFSQLGEVSGGPAWNNFPVCLQRGVRQVRVDLPGRGGKGNDQWGVSEWPHCRSHPGTRFRGHFRVGRGGCLVASAHSWLSPFHSFVFGPCPRRLRSVNQGVPIPRTPVRG